ncbi:Elongin-A [Halocaridina rubra]|uniref:Elongin-A n=1 Tax=Halocaridina rubra TaxID=373956 RepID=A0AAN8X1Q8_HALRR
MAPVESLLEQISHFQHKLEKYARAGETDKVLYYIHKLKHLQVTVKHLEATGVGRSVNSLRHNGGLVGEKARDLVTKWKMMVSAEEEEEEEEEEEREEEEHEVNNEEHEKKSDEEHSVDLGEINGEEAEDDEDDDDRLLIENEAVEEEEESNVLEYNPGGSNVDGYGYDRASPGYASDNSYNPLTSQMDYQLLNTGEGSGEYYPSTISSNKSYKASPENSEPEDEPMNVSSDRRNGSSSKSSSSKKSSKSDKEKPSKKKDKERTKDKHKDKESSGSHGKDKKKDHKDKHKSKHNDKEEKKDKYKGHKHKDKDRHSEKSKEKKGEEASEKTRLDAEKEKKKEIMNGFATPNYKSPPSKHSKHCSKTEAEQITPEKTFNYSHRKEERSRNKESKERESSDSEHSREKELSSREKELSSREKELSSRENKNKEKEKHKHRDKHSSSSSKKDKVKQDSKTFESQREIGEDGEASKAETKKKKSKSGKEGSEFGAALMGYESPLKKKKKKKKKDRKEKESSDDEKPSVSKTSHKRALSDGGDFPDAKKPRLLETLPQNLPKLPMSFSDTALETPLLPEITPNYKPLPRIPVRDDRHNRALEKMSEEETFNIMMQSKTSRRSKMYSGRVTGLQSVPSLKQCCIKVMIDYIDAIEYTGNVPYDILKPVLDRASPQQLLNIEDFNPYLLEDTDEIWEVHCRREFRKEQREDMESWRDLYIRCFDAREKKLKSLTENLQQKFISKAEPRRQTKLAFVDTAVKVPKYVQRAQAKHGTGVASGSSVKAGKAAEVAARKLAMQNAQRAEKAAPAPRTPSAKNKKVAPLMAKTRQFYKKAFCR